MNAYEVRRMRKFSVAGSDELVREGLGGPASAIRFEGNYSISELQVLLWRRANVLRLRGHRR